MNTRVPCKRNLSAVINTYWQKNQSCSLGIQRIL